MQGEEFSTDWIFLPPLKQTNRHKNENLRPNLHHYHHIIIMITTIIMIDIIWNFSPPLSHPGRGSFPSNSWTMDMALSKYKYTKGKLWHTSNLLRIPRVYPCKFFLAGVNFYRFNAKNCHFRQILREKVAFFFFTDLTRKIAVFRCKFYSPKNMPV